MSYRTVLVGGRPLAHVTRRYAWTIPLVVVLGLVGTALEGFGIGLIVPLLEVLDPSSDAGARGRLAGMLARVGAGLDTGTRLLFISGIILSLIVAKEIVIFANRVFVAWIYGKVGHDIRVALAGRLFEVGYPFFLQHNPGRLINILANETWKAVEAVQTAFEIIMHLSAIAIFLVFLLLLSWQMTVAVVAGLLLIQAVQALLAKRLGGLSERLIEENNLLASRMLDAIEATRLVRLFGQERRERTRFANASEKVRACTFKLDARRWCIQPTVEILHITLFLAVLIGAHGAGVSFPLIAAFIVLLYRMQPHARAVQAGLAQLRSWSGPIREVDWLLDTSDKPPPPPGSRPFAGLRHAITFQHVSFRYPGGVRTPALEGASFVIRKGRSTAIIGRSGSGKTTIVGLLCRFLEPTGGVIMVDGTPLTAIDPRQWRSHLALASQDLELVDGTVFDNIAYGAADASPEAVEEAARIADAHDFIAALPQGYATPAGHRGVALSAGQRQRIALGRALARDPDILILDEATSAVDGLSEASIFEALRRRSGGRTTIVISHRKSTLAFCDDGIVVQDGRVTAHGALRDLGVLEREDLYD